MRLHLIFENEILEPLRRELVHKGYDISGTDVTLEQFRDYVLNAETVPADIALLDGTLGVASVKQSISVLKEIRAAAPDLRLIVVLPEQAEKEWIQFLGRIGIYDVHCVETFDIHDVQFWIEHRMTVFDVPDDGEVPGGKIHKNVLKWRSGNTKTRTVEVERIVGCVTLGIAGVTARSGCTHLALSIASFLANSGYKVALAELSGKALEAIRSDTPSECAGGWKIQGVDVFSGLKVDEMVRLLGAGYHYAVLDFGRLGEEQLREYLRCNMRFLVSGCSDWDQESLAACLSKLLKDHPSEYTCLVNFSDHARFEMISRSLSAKQKKELKLRFFRVPFDCEPLRVQPCIAEWLEPVLPKTRNRSIVDVIKSKVREAFYIE